MSSNDFAEETYERADSDLHSPDSAEQWDAMQEIKGIDEWVLEWVANSPAIISQFVRENEKKLTDALFEKRLNDGPDGPEYDHDEE
jgi:hypothetical protein